MGISLPFREKNAWETSLFVQTCEGRRQAKVRARRLSGRQAFPGCRFYATSGGMHQHQGTDLCDFSKNPANIVFFCCPFWDMSFSQDLSQAEKRSNLTSRTWHHSTKKHTDLSPNSVLLRVSPGQGCPFALCLFCSCCFCVAAADSFSRTGLLRARAPA